MTNTREERVARVLAVANGETINGTYKQMPIAALDAFREDLKRLLEPSPDVPSEQSLDARFPFRPNTACLAGPGVPVEENPHTASPDVWGRCVSVIDARTGRRRRRCVEPGEPSSALEGMQKLLAKYEYVR